MREGNARVYLWPEPDRGAHEGFRGYIVADELGVHLDSERTEHLAVDNDHPTEEWPMGDWMELEHDETVPWHRIHSISWGDDFAVPPLEGSRKREGRDAG